MVISESQKQKNEHNFNIRNSTPGDFINPISKFKSNEIKVEKYNSLKNEVHKKLYLEKEKEAIEKGKQFMSKRSSPFFCICQFRQKPLKDEHNIICKNDEY